MSVRQVLLLAATCGTALACSQGAAFAHARHHHYYHHARYAGWYGRDVAAVEYPYGGRVVVASRPVPDTPFNRARFGGPMSFSGRMTAPIGN